MKPRVWKLVVLVRHDALLPCLRWAGDRSRVTIAQKQRILRIESAFIVLSSAAEPVQLMKGTSSSHCAPMAQF